MSERTDDFERLRDMLCDAMMERAADDDDVAALARIQAHVEALEGALREVRKVADRNYAEPITFTIVEMCDAALAGESEEVRHG